VGARTSFGNYYGCVLLVHGEAFDCRLILDGQTLQLGRSYELPVALLNPDLVLPMLKQDTAIALWKEKTIAEGKVMKLLTPV